MKSALLTLVFYAACYGLMELANKLSPGGPCVPGLGVIVFFAFAFVPFILLIRSIYLILHRDKRNWYTTGIHLLVCIFIIVAFSLG